MALEVEPLEPKDLFGGAIRMDVPARLADVSDSRPVPDNQEVFSDGAQDQSLIVEILELHASVSAPESASFYFADVASLNGDASPTLEARGSWEDGPAEGASKLPAGTPIHWALGTQRASKGQQGAEASNLVQVIICCVRLAAQSTDLVISLNTPTLISARSAAAEHAGAGAKTLHQPAPRLFHAMLRTLSIRDWSLFGPA